MKRRIAMAVLGAVLLPGAFLVTGGAASAKKAPPGTNSCTLTGTGTITPGISNTPAKQTLKVTTSLSGCTGSVPAITSSSPNTTTTTSKKPESCSTLATSTKTKETQVISWNDGESSTSKFTLTLASGSATLAGKITAGTFKKDKFTGSASFSPGAGQNCVSTPVTSVTISGSVSLS
jgi:hypothetical protein